MEKVNVEFHPLEVTDNLTLMKMHYALNVFGSDLCILAFSEIRETVTFHRKEMEEARGWTEAGRCLNGNLKDGTIVSVAHFLAHFNDVLPSGKFDARTHRPTLDNQAKNNDYGQKMIDK